MYWDGEREEKFLQEKTDNRIELDPAISLSSSSSSSFSFSSGRGIIESSSWSVTTQLEMAGKTIGRNTDRQVGNNKKTSTWIVHRKTAERKLYTPNQEVE